MATLPVWLGDLINSGADELATDLAVSGAQGSPQDKLPFDPIASVNDFFVNALTGKLTVRQQSANSQSGAMFPLSQEEKDKRLALVQTDAVSGAPGTLSLPSFPKLNLPNLFPGLTPDIANVALWGAVLLTVLIVISLLND